MITTSIEETNNIRQQLGLQPLTISLDRLAEEAEEAQAALKELEDKIDATAKAAETMADTGLVRPALNLMAEVERLKMEVVR